MRFFKLIFHLLLSIKKNTTKSQLILFILLFFILGLIGLVTLIKVLIPFTYIAL